MRRITNISLLFCFLLIANSSKAQLIPNFGAQRAGLSTLSFLKNDVNARSMAMASTSVALKGDGYSTFTNPAAITDVQGFNASISNFSIGAGIQQSFASVILPRKDKLSAFGFSLNMLNSGAMDVRTEFQPNGTGEKFYVTNLAVGFTYAQKLSDMFSAGLSLKYIHEQIENYNNGTIAADVSFLYYTAYKDLNFAVRIQNFGGNSSLSKDEIPNDFNRGVIESDEYSVPTVFSLGASLIPWRKDKHQLLTSLQLNHPNDNAENYSLGAEYSYAKLIFVRTGIRINVKGQKLPTLGLGINQTISGHDFQINYAVNPTEFIGIQHTVGLSFTFNKTKNRDEE